MATFANSIRRGLRSAQPAGTAVGVGTLYFVTDEDVTERSNGTTWDAYSGAAGGVPALTILQRSTDQTISNNSFTAVSWTTTPIQDDVSAFSAGSPTIVTVPVGYTRVRVTVKIEWANNSTGARVMQVNKNAGTIIDGDERPPVFQSPAHLMTRWHTVAAANTLKVEVYQNSGGNLALVGASPAYGGTYVQFEWEP